MDFGDAEENVGGVQLNAWTAYEIGVQIDFVDPLAVEKGEVTTLKFKDPSLFVSAASGESLPASKARTSKIIPKQVPSGIDGD